MKAIAPVKSILKILSPYFIVSFLSLLYAYLFLKLYRADWRVPFFYGGDAMFHEMLIKGVIENGWYLSNNRLGMPYGTNLHDFPMPDTFSLLLFKLAGLFTFDSSLILNLYYISTYPLTAITTLYVLRQFNITFYPALLGSLLYTFIPYHLYRSEIHLFYATYYVIPLLVLVIIWACSGGERNDSSEDHQLRLSPRNPKLIFSVIVCLLIASTGGVYYAFFGCYLLLVAGIARAIALKNIRHLLLPGVLITVITGAMLINLAPSIIYQYKNGITDTALRVPSEAEIYGLKITQLVMPVTGHRIGSWRRAKDQYNSAPLVTENDSSTLGAIPSIGFLILLGWVVCSGLMIGRREGESSQNLLGQLSVLNISAVLLGTIGGFSSLFALFVSPKIRGYNRISIYIGFFALFAIVLLLDGARQRYFQTRGLRATFNAVVILITILGLLDQTARHMVPNYTEVKKVFENDAEFVRRIESSVTPGAMIFQLPVKRFPETHPIERLYDYDLLKGFMHSNQLRWSYGAMRGRAGDSWQALLVANSIPEMVETIAFANFEGIYIDRFGYADNASKLEDELAVLTETKPLVSEDERMAFFNLATYRNRLQEKYSVEELARKKDDALYPLLTIWREGFSALENFQGKEWRWCGSSGELVLNNLAQYPRRVTVEMSLETQSEGNMRIESPFFSERLKTNPEPKQFSKTFEIPPGEHKLMFFSDARKIYTRSDFRSLVFRVTDFKLKYD
jgi:hypothetical protein